jgi:hypothetical protein
LRVVLEMVLLLLLLRVTELCHGLLTHVAA